VRFYYLSIFSLMLLGVLYLVGTGLLVWFGSSLRKRWKRAWIVMVPLFLLLYTAPVAEEFWIAWNFGQLCRKDAGIFISKTVEVEGFYDATGATLDLVRPGGYRFIESHGAEGKGTIRLSFGDAELKQEAFARYEKEFPGRNAAEQDMIRVKLDERTEVLVYPKKGDSWRITKLDHPTARYYFGMDSGRDIGHKLGKQESRVTDSQTGEAIGEYRVYIREAPWYFIGLGRPNMGCDGPEGGPHTKHENSFLIYRDILKPINLSRAEKG
jgi:hypothetical protein